MRLAAAHTGALAVHGGEPVRRAPLPPWPVHAPDEIAAVTRVLASGRVNYLVHGDEGRGFEREFAALCGVRHAVALANGTVALELALRVLGVGPGDEVIVTPRSFFASASAVVTVGAIPVFADVDENSQNLTAESIAAVLTPRCRAIICVHVAGWPCDMDSIVALARSHGIRIIEDCAQAHGATYKGRPVGSLGDVAAFSFCQDKIMTTGGEGGMLVTDDDDLWERAWSYKDHGKSWDAVYRRRHPPGFLWLHESFGTNWRLTEMQSALGRAQLPKLPEWLTVRRRNAAILDQELAGLPGLRLTVPPAEVGHSRYRYFAFVDPEAVASGWDRDAVTAAVRAEGFPCLAGICGEIYREKAFRDAGIGPVQSLPTARRLAQTGFVLLVHPTLAEAEMEEMTHALRKVMDAAVRGEAPPPAA